MSTPVSAHRQRDGWLMLSWVTAFLVGTDLFIIAPLLPSMAREMKVAPSSLTVLVSVFSLTYAVASPIVGRFAQRMGLARQLQMGVCLLGAANLYTALASSVVQLALSRLLAGLGAASITPMLYALAAERAAVKRRGRSLAVVSSGLVLALAGGAPLGLLLGEAFHWRPVFGGLGAALLVTVPIHHWIWRFDRGGLGRDARAIPPVGQAEEGLRDAATLLVGMALWAASVYGTYTLIGTALEDGQHWPPRTVAVMLACFGVGATLGSLSGGRLADRFGAVAVIRWHFLLTAFAFGVAVWAYGARSPWLLGPALFGVAALAYAIFPSLQTVAAERFLARRTVVLGLLSSALYVGITAGASMGGAVYPLGGMQAVLVACAGLAALGHGLGWWMDVPRGGADWTRETV